MGFEVCGWERGRRGGRGGERQREGGREIANINAGWNNDGDNQVTSSSSTNSLWGGWGSRERERGGERGRKGEREGEREEESPMIANINAG